MSIFIPGFGAVDADEYKLLSTLMRNKFKKSAETNKIFNRLGLILTTQAMTYSWGAITPPGFMTFTPRGKSAKKDDVAMKAKLNRLFTITGGVLEHRDNLLALESFGDVKTDLVDGSSTAFFDSLEALLLETMLNLPGFFGVADPEMDTTSDDGEPYFSNDGDVDNIFTGTGVTDEIKIVNDYFNALEQMITTRMPNSRRKFFGSIGNPLALDIIVVGPAAILKVLSHALMSDLLPAYISTATSNATMRNQIASFKPDFYTIPLLDDIDTSDWYIFIADKSLSRSAHPFAFAFNNSSEFNTDRSIEKINGIEVGYGSYGTLMKVEFLDEGSSLYIHDSLWSVVTRSRCVGISAVRQRGIQIANS